MIGLVVVRSGRLQLGAQQVASAADELWLLGSGVGALDAVPAGTTRRIELGDYAPHTWSTFLASELRDTSVVLSSAPDGRDLAGRLGEVLGLDVFAGCTAISATSITMPRYGGATSLTVAAPARFVATVQARSGDGALFEPEGPVEQPRLSPLRDARVRGELPPDLETLDLADATRILAGGAGLRDAARFDDLATLAPRLGAAMGATRVITDRGWVPFRRQIGTTGASVSPELYVAFGISGAVQHTSGIGSPSHVISINLDPACPMSQMADLAVVADADATLSALLALSKVAT